MPKKRRFFPEICDCGNVSWMLTGKRFVVMVDAQDAHIIEEKSWAPMKTGYLTDGKGNLLHRVIMQPPPDILVDHVNRDAADCRRENMRLATHRQNSAYSRRGFEGRSRFRGVSAGRRGRWVARIRHSGCRIFIGSFDTEEQAAIAYDIAAKEHHGEFAMTNF